MDLDLRLLRSFAVIFEQGSLARASERLHCTSAALSMRLKTLEAEIGAPLFHRLPGGLDPTPRGSELYARALGVLSAYDEMMSATRSRPVRDRVRIGLPDDYAIGWLADALQTLGTRFEQTEIEIVCDLSANLMARAQRQEIDLALVTLAARPALARAAAEVALRWIGTALPEVALAAYPEGCVFRREMIRVLEASGRSWRVAVQSMSHAGIVSAVRSGRTVTAVAAGTAPTGLREFEETEILPRLANVPIYLVSQDKPRNTVAAIELALREAVPAFANSGSGTSRT